MNKVIIPKKIRLVLERELDKLNIEHNILFLDDLPDGYPGGCEFKGKTYIGPDAVCVIESNLSKEDIYEILNKFF